MSKETQPTRKEDGVAWRIIRNDANIKRQDLHKVYKQNQTGLQKSIE